MALSADKKTIQEIYDSLKIIRKGSEDDFELRASADEKVWGVKLWDEPSKPTFVIYAGADARDLACDAADYDADEDDEEEDDDEDDTNGDGGDDEDDDQ